ncbi:hypothetical protein I7I50_00584 [Histoplasma capsulatum G186AR]|uniref:Uncharacterized protein n=1 Tax=Ajellomyces capsulatus TaxID=5037 RepID=A0A8H7YFW7_AJECA|nr:hypothetical protein I7I52_07852 [Histoplasma capsulatum]QSS72665.1 hypothetical protein I7I50_00584 [Histoplasma capsulatum G186AR]
MAPGKHHIIKAAVWVIYAEFGPIYLVPKVGVVCECFRIDNSLIEGASNRECISNHIPLAFCTEKEEKLSQIMNQARELHPSWLTITSDGFSRLKKMANLGEGGIRI